MSIVTPRDLADEHRPGARATEFRHTPETRRKLSEMRKGEKNPFFGKKHSAETIAKLRERTRQQNASRTYDISPCTLKDFSEIEAAYLAAMVDGEGSITVHHTAYVVAVYNTSEPLMAWLVTHIGGAYCVGHRNGRTPCYQWNLSSARNVHRCLIRIRQYMVIKQDKATATIAALELKYGGRING